MSRLVPSIHMSGPIVLYCIVLGYCINCTLLFNYLSVPLEATVSKKWTPVSGTPLLLYELYKVDCIITS